MTQHLVRLRDKLFLQYHHWKERDDDLLVFIFLGNGPFSSAIQSPMKKLLLAGSVRSTSKSTPGPRKFISYLPRRDIFSRSDN